MRQPAAQAARHRRFGHPTGRDGSAIMQQSALLASWRVASTQITDTAEWADADQWWTPAVDALADALVGEPVDAASASEQLGRQRAAAGVFLDSARRDVMNAT